jgi:hypothetical protein
VESHISRKTSEIWGTRDLLFGQNRELSSGQNRELPSGQSWELASGQCLGMIA